MRYAFLLSFVLVALLVACAGDDIPTSSPAPALTPAASLTPTTSPTRLPPTPSATPSVLPTPPGSGLYQRLAIFAGPISGPLTPGSETEGLYIADGETVLSLIPASEAEFELNAIPSPSGAFIVNGGELGLTRTSLDDGLAYSAGPFAGLGEFQTGLMYPCAWVEEPGTVVFAFRRQGSPTPDGFGVYDFDTERLTVIDRVNLDAGTSPAVQDCPALSSDGLSLLYHGLKDGAEDLYVAPIDGGPAKPVAPGAPIDARGTPAALPDGSIVTTAILPDPPATGGANNYEIVRVSARGNVVTNLTVDGRYDFASSVSADTTTLAFLSTRDGELALFTLALTTAGATPAKVATLEGEPADFAIAASSWSPDGTRLAVTTGDTASARIYIVDLASGSVTRVGERIRFGVAPNWLPDGSGIIF